MPSCSRIGLLVQPTLKPITVSPRRSRSRATSPWSSYASRGVSPGERRAVWPGVLRSYSSNVRRAICWSSAVVTRRPLCRRGSTFPTRHPARSLTQVQWLPEHLLPLRLLGVGQDRLDFGLVFHADLHHLG